MGNNCQLILVANFIYLRYLVEIKEVFKAKGVIMFKRTILLIICVVFSFNVFASKSPLDKTDIKIINETSHFAGFPVVKIMPIKMQVCCGKDAKTCRNLSKKELSQDVLYNRNSITKTDNCEVYVGKNCKLKINSVKVVVQLTKNETYTFTKTYNDPRDMTCAADTVMKKGHEHNDVYLYYYINGKADVKNKGLCCSNAVTLGKCQK